MLSANEKRPLNALANESSAPGARSCTIWAIPRPSSIASVASLISSRFATGLSRPHGLPTPGMSPEAMSCAALVASPAATS